MVIGLIIVGIIGFIIFVNLLSKNKIRNEGVIINGVKWAAYNVDAPKTFASNSEDTGMFYQWNRKMGWRARKYGGGMRDNITPIGTTWEKSNDPSPDGWRVPTIDEINTLLDENKVSQLVIVNDNVPGTKFTDKATGNSIFLPAAGWCDHDGSLQNESTGYNPVGCYWSNAQVDSEEAYYMSFRVHYNTKGVLKTTSRSFRQSVRCVADI